MAKTIQDVRGMSAQPQTAFQYEVEIVGLSSGNEEGLTIRAQSASIPQTSNDAFEINFKDRRTFFKGRDTSPHTVSITFYDTEDWKAYEYFQNWHDQLISNPVTGGGVTSELYKATAIIKTFSTDGETETSRTTLKNAFPTEIGEISLSYDTNENITFDVTLQFDQKLFETV